MICARLLRASQPVTAGRCSNEASLVCAESGGRIHFQDLDETLHHHPESPSACGRLKPGNNPSIQYTPEVESADKAEINSICRLTDGNIFQIFLPSGE